MNELQITLRQVSSENADFHRLCSELDSFLNRAIGGEDKREKYKKYNYPDSMDYVVVAYLDQLPVGCAALRKYTEHEVELKRVFVQEAYRGQSIGGRMLRHLIAQAKTMDFQRIILETGAFLDASVRLYRRYGFIQINNYGDYKNLPESLCMGRCIETPHIARH